MPLFKNLFSARNESNKYADKILPANKSNGPSDRKSVSFQKDQIRVLLFRDCERRGEQKLLFDSISVEKIPVKFRCGGSKNSVTEKDDIYIEIDDEFVYEYKKVECDDVGFLKEMVFGSVAMTYRGPSFKIHAMNSPRRIMCAKVFPAPEHTSCKQNERHSGETLGNSMSIDGNNDNGSSSMLTVVSQSNLMNSYGNRLSPELRKNSTSSSTGSSWDIDISAAPPAGGSSQSLESSSSSGVGSLSSLRRRWLRAISTSLSRSESEDLFGLQYCPLDGSHDNYDSRTRRHRTRIGLAVLVELTQGHERSMEARLLEHGALLEGMLDRLRRSCHRGGQNKGKGLVARMHRASTHCTLWLLRLFMNTTNLPTPLLWHKVLLTPNTAGELKVHTLQHSLQLMGRLFDDVDTKSTNFFLSTLVTAVLTHHLGWVHTVLSSGDRQLVETLAKRYPCNPLWAQLCDLYGALGTPLRVAHTVIVGETDKTDLINTVLSFLSYFIRSGNIERRRERRCSPQRELQEAVVLLKKLEAKGSLSCKAKRDSTTNDTSAGTEPVFSSRQMNAASSLQRKTSKRRVDFSADNSASTIACHNLCLNQNLEGKALKLKRSETMIQNLDALTTDSVKTYNNCYVKYKSFDDDECQKLSAFPHSREKDQNSNSVKIVVSESPFLERDKRREYLQRSTQLQELESKMSNRDLEAAYVDTKLESLKRYEGNDFDASKLCSDDTDGIESSLTSINQGNFGKEENVRFVLGGEEKSVESKVGIQQKCYCQCAFSRVPSTSAQLPEDVLRKIIQRNFPESSKSIKNTSSTSTKERSMGHCLNCFGASFAPSHTYEGNNLLLETPTNATEVLRTCNSASSVDNRGAKINRRNSLEYLMEANGVVELPMPRSKRFVVKSDEEPDQQAGLAGSLKFGEVRSISVVKDTDPCNTGGYTWGLVVQGLSKRKKKKRKKKIVDDELDAESEDEWLGCVRDEVEAAFHSPVVDQPISEALCIVADVDSWQVGVLSNNTPTLKAPLPVGMSRLVANMLEAFAYVWRKYHSPIHCVRVLEGKLREMWLRSEALAQMLIGAELEDVSVDSLTDALDLDAADIPVLLAVAATHSPVVARRFGLSLA
ncbi:folliculin-interacting protein 2 isoform X1 [Neodiprion lecontei]|uniref:Folliculin-interacting protein 2 isoform X1 n=1 Tax=Neodiprion lecontei TaxID=441921 RepID=A0A6J0BFQ3_NEOLC|nr:folliculin-interacting protein 2 isoform X1 [Neodiprion lecontei]